MELIASTRPRQLQILVRDNGTGIAAEHLPRLFEPFYRVSQARDVSGHMGLGLHLIKTHVEGRWAGIVRLPANWPWGARFRFCCR